jgi:hypothetical protein
MGVVTFLLLLVIAGIAAGVHVLITAPPPDVRSRYFAGLFVSFSLLLVLPTLLPGLLGG